MPMMNCDRCGGWHTNLTRVHSASKFSVCEECLSRVVPDPIASGDLPAGNAMAAYFADARSALPAGMGDGGKS